VAVSGRKRERSQQMVARTDRGGGVREGDLMFNLLCCVGVGVVSLKWI